MKGNINPRLINNIGMLLRNASERYVVVPNP